MNYLALMFMFDSQVTLIERWGGGNNTRSAAHICDLIISDSIHNNPQMNATWLIFRRNAIFTILHYCVASQP